MGRKLREENGVKLPKRVWRVIDGVRGGKTLCRYHRQSETTQASVEFFFEPGGKRIASMSAEQAINSGFLRPREDGLFGAETAQTWEAA